MVADSGHSGQRRDLNFAKRFEKEAFVSFSNKRFKPHEVEENNRKIEDRLIKDQFSEKILKRVFLSWDSTLYHVLSLAK